MEQSRQGPAFELWKAMERYRRNNGLTLEEFASRAHVGRQTLDRLKDSRTPPRLKTVHKIAAALDIEQKKAEAMAGHVPFDPEEEDLTAEEQPTERADTPDLVAVDTREAILRDPRLGEHAAVVLATYDAIVNAFNPPAPAARPARQPREEKRAS